MVHCITTDNDELKHCSSVASALIETNELHIPESVRRKLESSASLRILDLGSGDGTFTEKLLESRTPDRTSLFFSEKVDLVSALYANRLARFSPTRVAPMPDGPRINRAPDDLPVPILQYQHWLRDEVSKIHNGQADFDLVICSRILYYWQTGSIDLAYAVARYLVSDAGLLWIIAPDRNCAVFKERKTRLTAAKFPDVFSDSFSDSLLDRLRCLVRFDRGGSSLHWDEGKPFQLNAPAIQYLWKLTPTEAPASLDYSETHIILGKIAPEALSDVDAKLHGARVLGRCMGILRSCVPDAEFHQVSLASVRPDFSVRSKRPRREDIHLPWSVQNYRIRSFGYSYRKRNDTWPLKDYFSTNPSLLFYRQFFLNYFAHGEDDHCDYSVDCFFKKLGQAKVDNLKDYDESHIESGKEEHHISPADNHAFHVSLENLVTALKTSYSSEGGGLWLFCVGVNMLPDIPAVFTTVSLAKRFHMPGFPRKS